MKWNDLTMKERSDLMGMFLKHGMDSLSDMRRIYDDGGYRPSTRSMKEQRMFDSVTEAIEKQNPYLYIDTLEGTVKVRKGEKPLEVDNTIVDFTPAGDFSDFTSAGSELFRGNLGGAASYAALMFLPNILQGGIKKVKRLADPVEDSYEDLIPEETLLKAIEDNSEYYRQIVIPKARKYGNLGKDKIGSIERTGVRIHQRYQEPDVKEPAHAWIETPDDYNRIYIDPSIHLNPDYETIRTSIGHEYRHWLDSDANNSLLEDEYLSAENFRNRKYGQSAINLRKEQTELLDRTYITPIEDAAERVTINNDLRQSAYWDLRNKYGRPVTEYELNQYINGLDEEAMRDLMNRNPHSIKPIVNSQNPKNKDNAIDRLKKSMVLVPGIGIGINTIYSGNSNDDGK